VIEIPNRPGRMAPRPTVIVALAALLLAACPQNKPPEVAQATPEAMPAPVKAEAVEIESPLGSYLAGQLARRDNDMDAAAKYFLRTLAEDPDNPDLLHQAFIAVNAKGHEAEAMAIARRMIDVRPKDSIGGVALMVDAFKRGDTTAARSRLEALPKDGYNTLLAPLLQAWLRVADGDTPGAIETLDKLSESEGFTVFRQYHSALVHDIAGNADEADAAYGFLVMSETGGSYRSVAGYGSYLERAGRIDEARELYASYIETNPSVIWFESSIARLETGVLPPRTVRNARDGAAEVLFGVASALYQENALGAAMLYARLAGYLRPGFDAVNLLIGDIFEVQGRPEESIVAYRAVPLSSPLSWSVRLRLATNLDELERTDEAIAHLREMADERADRADALLTLGNLLRAKERWADAVAAYDEGLARIGHREPRHWRPLYARGIALERSRQWPRAEQDFLEALDLAPDQPSVLNYLGYSWVDQGINLDKALDLIERAVELRPEDGYIIDSLGWALYRMGKFDDAALQLERAVERRPDDPTINDHLGDAYWRVGRYVEARYQWRRALALQPTEEGAVATIEAKLRDGLSPVAVADGEG
jgi:tetratricopeptide (TPR) repeat protein